MDLTDRTCTLARSKERVFLAGFSDPAEAALALRINVRHVLSGGGNRDELLKVLLIGVRKDTVSAVTFLFFWLGVYVHLLLGISDLFDRKFNSTNFQDVSLLYFIVLIQNGPKSVYLKII